MSSLVTFVQRTRAEVRANRETWFDFIEQPARKKAQGLLDAGGGARCCLGHGACALGVAKSKVHPGQDAYDDGGRWAYGTDHNPSTAPEELVDMVGLYDSNGGSMRVGKEEINLIAFPGHRMLTTVNDQTDLTPQQIGAGLRKMIEGGIGTPFKPLTDYLETIPA